MNYDLLRSKGKLRLYITPEVQIIIYFCLLVMLFINISSDHVHMLDDQDEKFLPRNGIENTLGPSLLEYTQAHPVETLFLLN
jgi:hypothetical protein